MSKTQNFIDEIKIVCKSGNGGKGAVHFMRTKYNSQAGPDGGNGGRGGHIILKGNKHLWTLLHLRYKKHILASNGQNGSKNNCTGKDGDDVIIEVPLGTIIKDVTTKEKEVEILHDGETKILLEGGKGGLGNAYFKSATRQVPEYAQSGLEGKEEIKIFELKLLADVGLVGFPNAGKSTLLSVLSKSKTKIANYPFTTLTPTLGIIYYKDNLSFCMADLPGIIEGAAEGKGIGLRFLRHIERNSILLFLISLEDENPYHQFQLLKNEIKKYNPELLDKKVLIALTKADIIHDDQHIHKKKKTFPKALQPLIISSITHQGIEQLKDKIWKCLNEEE